MSAAGNGLGSIATQAVAKNKDTFCKVSARIQVMSTISVEELQLDPTALVDRLEAGEHFVLVRDGRPVAELRPCHSPNRSPRPMGLCAGEFTVPDDFDAPLPEHILREFEGR